MTDQQPGYEPPGYGYGGAYETGGYGPGAYETGGYGASGYGGYGPGGYGPGGYGPGGGFGPPDPRLKTQAMLALIFNIVACVLCCGIASLPGLIVGGIAMSKAETEPESARNLTKWSWICLGITVGLVVLAVAVFIILGMAGVLDDSSTNY